MACVGSDGDEMDRSTGLGNGFPGWRTKKRLSGQRASPLLFIKEEVFFNQAWRRWCHGRRQGARLDSLRLVGPQVSQQEHNDCRSQEPVAQWHGC